MIRNAIRPIIRNAIRPFVNSGVGGSIKALAALFPYSVTGTELSTVTTSRAGQAGADDVGAITIVGGEYQINNGTWTSDAGTVAEKDKVRIRLTSDADYETDAVATLTCNAEGYVFTVTTRAEDVVPDAFTFTDATGAELSTVTTSAAITVAGIDSTATPAISITGGEYEINDSGTWTSDAGTVELDDTVKVRGTSSASYETAVNVVLTIGTVSDTFSITTRAANLIPDAFMFVDQTGVEPETVTTSAAITIEGIEADISWTCTGGEADINDAGSWATSGTVSVDDTVKVRVTASADFEGTAGAIFSAGGVSDTFSVTTRAIDTTPEAFTFTDITGADLSTTYTSAAITASGFDGSLAISITCGEYEKNESGTWTSSTGNVEADDTVKVRVTSSSEYETAVNVVLTIGGVSDTYTVTTAADAPSDPLYLLEDGTYDGAWYDVQDMSTLFQDTAGTTPVTAAEQSVRLMQDKSGNDYHVTFSGTNPPTLEVDGDGYYYLQPVDGTSRGVCATLSLALPISVVGVWDLDGNALPGNQIIYDGYDNVTSGMYFWKASTSSKLQMISSAVTGSDGKAVYSQEWSATERCQRVGAERMSRTVGALNTSLSGLSLFNIRGNPNAIIANYHSMYPFYGAFFIERALGLDEFRGAESVVGGKSGISIPFTPPGVGYIIGDSTTADYIGYNTVFYYINTSVDKVTVAIPGDTIAEQKTAWASAPNKEDAKYIVIQVGLNDLSSVTSANIITALQDLVDTIIASVPATAKVIISCMTPARAGIDSTSYTRWGVVNEAIAGNGATPIVRVDGVVTAHVAAMSDGSDNLHEDYDHGDGVHPNNAGREVNADAIAAVLSSLGVL